MVLKDTGLAAAAFFIASVSKE